MSQARVTTTNFEVLTKPEANGRVSSLAIEVLHSVQEGEPPPTMVERRVVVLVVT